MSAKIIDGKAVSQNIREQIKKDAQKFEKENNRPIGLAVVLVGEDPASAVYVRNKIAACAETAIKSFAYYLPQTVSPNELIDLVEVLNKDNKVDGILVQLPLPKNLDENYILSLIDPKKDVDGFHAVNAGNLMLGNSCLSACTPSGIIELIRSTGEQIEGKHAVIIGRSNIVGKPAALLLLQNNATVTICHSKTEDLPSITKNADILVAAVGIKEFVKKDMIKPGAIIIDVGMNRFEGKLYGDVKTDECSENASYITPVPGGVGPMTITMLLSNTLNTYIKGMFIDELLLHDVEIYGEITEFTISNGNTFFSLQENGCNISCRKFSRHEQLPIGLKVIVTGSVSFYDKGGRINFIVKNITPFGEGEQHLKLLQIKKRLNEEGYFNKSKPLPTFIVNAAIITSASGAVIHDMMSVNKNRHNINFVLFDTRVQGENADKDIIESLKNIQKQKERFDCVIIARGGGANTDLECFNSEALAKKVALLGLPIISAVGHEVDYTLCDLCASVRAGTPSIAAEIISQINDKMFDRLYKYIDKFNDKLASKYKSVENRMYRLLSRMSLTAESGYAKANRRLSSLSYRLNNASQKSLNTKYNKTIAIARRLNHIIAKNYDKKYSQFILSETVLEKLSPLKILNKGYAKIYKDKAPIKSLSQVVTNDKIDIVLHDGTIGATVIEKRQRD
ncbi:c-1-tetrahydrofolate synthase cytoplasmic-related [Holotrichia oblita]|nr:c-1-tetrahydrofolate synthase cytoplasmic-related [Holotrichia oblita]